MPKIKSHGWGRESTRGSALSVGLALILYLLLNGANAFAKPISVFVSILPQAGFVAEIGGPSIEVQVLVGPGHSPAIYEPTPRQMAALSGAKLFFSAGVPFERGLVPKISGMSSAPIISGPKADSAHAHDGHDHDHGDEIDPHFWLDPLQAAAMADSVCFHLSKLVPGAAAEFAARRDEIKARLTALDLEIADLLASARGARFFVFHPAYGHFAKRYGLVQIAVEGGGHEPGARRLATVIDQAKAANAQVIVVQPQFSKRSAEAVAKGVDAEILVLDPLARDYENNLRHIAAALASALGSRQ